MCSYGGIFNQEAGRELPRGFSPFLVFFFFESSAEEEKEGGGGQTIEFHPQRESEKREKLVI